MSIFGLPLNNFQVPSGVDMGDLEFIEGKVLTGDYFQVSGDIDTVGTTIDFTPGSGKTAFLIEANIVANQITTVNAAATAQNLVIAELIIDTIVRTKTKIGLAYKQNSIGGTFGFGGAGYGTQDVGKFNVLGLSLVGDGNKKIEIKNAVSDGKAFATMSGYVIVT